MSGAEGGADVEAEGSAAPGIATAVAAASSAARATGLALGAIALWSTLAAFGVMLAHMPPFLLTGLALVIGSVWAWPWVRRWRVPARTLAVGVYGLFGFHLLLFLALRHAPAVESNLVNYLWPLLIVVMTPLFLPALRLKPLHVLAAFAGLAGAALAILGGRELAGGFAWGYLAALASAFAWASYSLLTRRLPPFPTAAVGLFALVSGVLALLCHAAFEPAVVLSARDWLLVTAVGLGPLGAAFYLWDAALKRGDPRSIGTVAYLTPLASTVLLIAVTGRTLTPWIAASALLIVGAAAVAVRAR